MSLFVSFLGTHLSVCDFYFFDHHYGGDQNGYNDDDDYDDSDDDLDDSLFIAHDLDTVVGAEADG